MSAGTIRAEMFRARPHSIRIQLLTENDMEPVTAALSLYSHRLIGKLSHSDADSDAIFDLEGIFTNEDDVEKIVEAIIPAAATDVPELPEGRTTRIYVQWQTTDGADEPWIVADGSIPVRSSLPRTA